LVRSQPGSPLKLTFACAILRATRLRAERRDDGYDADHMETRVSDSRSPLVETEWLAKNLSTPGIVVLDGSWHLPAANRDARSEYNTEHIPGALFFDIDELSNDATALSHMLPSSVKFASRMKKMGVGDGMKIVVYDSLGLFSAPRVWWTFKVMGHKDVVILNGGLKKWKAEGRPLEDLAPVARSTRHYTPTQNNEWVRDLAEMTVIVSDKSVQIADARPAGRFEGRDPEPRAGLRPGHMPGAKNIPQGSLVNADGTLKSVAELRDLFRTAGIDASKPVVTTCGSGVTAATLVLALNLLGQPNASLYDGAWSEWGQDNGLPVATGPA
jgi:thiosulfate/3-mercaptopyruvate sulfurtransferase